MADTKKEQLTKCVLSLSATSCLTMITTARPLPLLQWLVCCGVLAVLVWKRKNLAEDWGNALFNRKYLLAGGFISAALGYVFFYSTWAYSELFGKIGSAMGISARILALGAAGGLIVLSTPFLALLIAALWIKGCDVFGKMEETEKIHAGKAVWILLAVFALGICAIVRANFYYIDDLGRAAQGYKQWQFFSRYLSTVLSTYLHGDAYLTDVSPLGQLLAAVILAGSAVLLLCAVYDRKAFFGWELAAIVPVGLNPYILECLSYKYDAPYMALSIFGAVFPLLYRKQPWRLYAAASVIGTLVVCTTYQAASGIYPMLVILIALRLWCEGEKLRKIVGFCALSAGSYGLGLVLFQQFILRPEKTYAGSVASLSSLLPTLTFNYRKFYGLVLTDFKLFWLLLIATLAVGLLIKIVVFTKQKKVATAILGLVSLFLMALLCFGVYPALEDASFDPRAMYGFGVMTALLAVAVAEGKRLPVFKLTALALSWVFLVFALTYGNALYVQREYTDFRIQMVIEDLNDLDIAQRDEPVRIEVVGTIGQSPILRNMPQNYQILNRLVPNNFNGDWMWGVFGLHHYYDMKNTVWVEYSVTELRELELLRDTMYHTIWGNEECIQIHLK